MAFKNENVIITGGGTGIGLALATQLLAAGNHVTICGRRNEQLQKAQKDHLKLHILACDITITSDQDRLFDAAEAHGPVTMLINNAGFFTMTGKYPHEGSSDEEIENLFKVNCVAPLQLTRRMVERGQKNGRIVQIGSLAAMAPMETQAIYAGTKAAIKHSSYSLRRPLKKLGFHMIHVQTPATDTAMTDGLNVPGMKPEVLAQRILRGAEKNRSEVRPHLDNFTTELGMRFAPWILNKIASRRYKHLQ